MLLSQNAISTVIILIFLSFTTVAEGQVIRLDRVINNEINKVLQPNRYRQNSNNYNNNRSRNYNTGNNNYQRQQSANTENSNNIDVYNDEDEYLFIKFYSKKQYVDERSTQFYKATQRNILNIGEDEDEFLKELIYFSANNKLGNKSMHRCRFKTITYTVVQRDSTTLPSVVDAKYEYKEVPGVFYNMRFYLSAGLPFRIHYTSDNLWSRRINEEGVIGSLYYTYEDKSRILQLEDKLVNEISNNNQKYVYPRINDSLTKLIKTKFPGVDCSKCLVRTVKPNRQTYEIETTDAFGHKTYDYKSGTTYHISIKNNCSKKLKVVGIWQSVRYPGPREYKFVFKTYKPGEELTWDIDYSPTLFDHHEVDNDDIDLTQINKPFNFNGNEYQWLRIIQDK